MRERDSVSWSEWKRVKERGRNRGRDRGRERKREGMNENRWKLRRDKEIKKISKMQRCWTHWVAIRETNITRMKKRKRRKGKRVGIISGKWGEKAGKLSWDFHFFLWDISMHLTDSCLLTSHRKDGRSKCKIMTPPPDRNIKVTR